MTNIFRYGIRFAFLPISNLFGDDKLDNATPTEQKTDKTVVQPETGWDRVKQMFQTDEFGNVSPEANTILQVAAMSIFVGSIYGGVVNSRGAYIEFMKNNQATSFINHFEAKRQLQDAVTKSFAKGAFRWGWRVTLFTSTFVGISTIIQVYRGKYGISEYAVAGGTAGAMYKFNMGPKGWIVGAGLGSVLGLACGCATMGLLKLAGMSIEDARYWQSQWKHGRMEYLRKGMAEHLEEKDFAVIKLHDIEVGEAGKDIQNLDSDTKSHNS
ncbi:unnamed protein product [Callosobruchus maculatus]|uniref:Complex I assembly factor TIMMDC1, mitochondrial n=1 Tax=Callosobruchus maculatus TaxID=64391 RepID=A0A653CLR0_CALMS|nr:unnamed protein product [Callosobruchus maculatus]